MSRSDMSGELTVYLHFPCFDGVVSAVLASEYLEHKRGWQLKNLIPLGYSERDAWASRSLKQPAAVVDFLYHPNAGFWADHHETTFLTPVLRQRFERNRSAQLFYDPSALSCAAVIWRNTHRVLRNSHFREMVHWANVIDGAKYDSANDAVLGEAPALRINLSFGHDPSRDYCDYLVQSLRTKSLAAVAASREVEGRYRTAHKKIKIGQRHFKKFSRLEQDGIVVYHVDDSKASGISRYAPYLEYPKALYSVGILNSKEETKITAMRNPWRHFKSVPLGQIFRRYGGGGHQRVASAIVNSQEAEHTLESILADLRQARSSKASHAKDIATGD